MVSINDNGNILLGAHFVMVDPIVYFKDILFIILFLFCLSQAENWTQHVCLHWVHISELNICLCSGEIYLTQIMLLGKIPSFNHIRLYSNKM